MRRRALPWPGSIVAIARSLAATGAWCWLDGEASVPGGGARRSYLGAANQVVTAASGHEAEFFARLRHDLASSAAAMESGEFDGGWVVALSYEFGVEVRGIESARDVEATAVGLRLGVVLALDHDARTAELRASSESELDEWMRQHGEALRGGAPNGDSTNRESTNRESTNRDEIRTDTIHRDTIRRDVTRGVADEPAPIWRRTADDYRAAVERCKLHIGDGDAYVLCLTDTAHLDVPRELDPIDVFVELRRAGPGLRGGLISVANRALLSISPERFLSVSHGSASTHPIKGTAARVADAASDRRAATALLENPKERAENLMIVDLMRNDLSRVCVPGTVEVTKFLAVEAHPHVHQLVSSIRGTMRADVDVFDVLESCIPGGSMTGAPKHRAVELLAEIEGGPRGLYSGCFGWVGTDANGEPSCELAMTIRSIELRELGSDRARALIGAGGGITGDSVADDEFREKTLKAAPMIEAVRRASRVVRRAL